MIRTVIVDDEPLARQRLRHLLREERDFDVVAEAADGPEAVEVIRRERPDLVFLDVQMPEMDGFEVIREIGAAQFPAVVFVTAFEQYAVGAFDVNAVDYLLKPLTRERLAAAVARVRARAQQPGDGGERLEKLLGELERRPTYLERLLVRAGGRIVVVKLADLDWVDGAGNYLKLHCGKNVYLLRHTLGGLEGRLDPRRFLRIHRSTIVNVDRVAELQTSSSGDYVLVLEDGTRLPMSRGYRHQLDVLAGETQPGAASASAEAM
jgi:two-component system LytT family response regulator